MDSSKQYSHLSDEQMERVHAACEAFEEALFGRNTALNATESIELRLNDAPDALRGLLFSELLAIELDFRKKSNDLPDIDEYNVRFPERGSEVEQVFREVSGRDAADSKETDLGLSVGSQVGPYKLHELIGEGGMGLVYAAEQEVPVRRMVALKIIKPGMDTKEVISRFETERQTLALMEHPNIAQVLDVGATEIGRPYFVMELLRGVKVTAYCDKQKLSLRARLELFVQICQAVHHAHQKGIIHRDIKPSNILVAVNGDVVVPKVIDFGVAKAINHRLTERTVYTQFSQLVGTPMYMSPEQAEQSAVNVDTRTDIYSLGAVLYELLAGVTPFTSEQMSDVSFDEMRRIIREEDPPSPSHRLSALAAKEQSSISRQRATDQQRLAHATRGELDWIVMKAMEKDVTRRYETAREFAADIQNYLADAAVLACPPTAVYRLGKFFRRNKVAVVLTTIVGVGLLAGIAGLAVSNIMITQQKHAAELAESNERTQRLLAEQQKTEALRQQAEAQTQRQRADLNFSRAREAVDRYFTMVSETKLLDEPGLLPLRKELIENALEFYQSCFDRGDAGPDMIIELANIRLRLGVMHLTLASGDAVSEFEQGFDLVEQLLDRLAADDIEFRRLAGFYPGFRSAAAGVYSNLKVYATDPRHDAALLRGAALWRSFANAHPQVTGFRRDLVFLEGYVKWQRRRAPVDLEDLREFVKQHPDDKQLLAELAYVVHIRGYIKEDLDLLREGVDKLIEADLPAYRDALALWRHRIGWRLLESGQSSEAAVELRKSVAMFRKLSLEFPHVDAYDLRAREIPTDLARALAKSGQVSEAEQLASAVSLRTGSDYVMRGNIYSVIGQTDKAIADYGKAAEIGLQGQIPHVGRVAEFLDKHKQHEKAILFHDHGVRTTPEPNVSRRYADRAACWMFLKRYDKALADFSSSIEINAWQCEHHLSRMRPTMLRESPADFQAAFLKLADRAIEITGGNGESYITRGMVLHMLRQREKAKEDLARGVKLDPEFKVRWYLNSLLKEMQEEKSAE